MVSDRVFLAESYLDLLNRAQSYATRRGCPVYVVDSPSCARYMTVVRSWICRDEKVVAILRPQVGA